MKAKREKIYKEVQALKMIFFRKKKNPFSDHLRKEVEEVKALSSQYEETRQQLLANLAKIQEVMNNDKN